MRAGSPRSQVDSRRTGSPRPSGTVARVAHIPARAAKPRRSTAKSLWPTSRCRNAPRFPKARASCPHHSQPWTRIPRTRLLGTRAFCPHHETCREKMQAGSPRSQVDSRRTGSPRPSSVPRVAHIPARAAKPRRSTARSLWPAPWCRNAPRFPKARASCPHHSQPWTRIPRTRLLGTRASCPHHILGARASCPHHETCHEKMRAGSPRSQVDSRRTGSPRPSGTVARVAHIPARAAKPRRSTAKSLWPTSRCRNAPRFPKARASCPHHSQPWTRIPRTRLLGARASCPHHETCREKMRAGSPRSQVDSRRAGCPRS